MPACDRVGHPLVAFGDRVPDLLDVLPVGFWVGCVACRANQSVHPDGVLMSGTGTASCLKMSGINMCGERHPG
jgi:hypothetical protein